MYQAVFICFLLYVCHVVWATGDARRYWAVVIITGQTMALYGAMRGLPNNDTALAVVYLIGALGFVWGSVRPEGAALGVLSAFAAIICIFGAWGLIPSAPGQGVAFNVHNWTTILEYGQLAIILKLAKDASTFRHH